MGDALKAYMRPGRARICSAVILGAIFVGCTRSQDTAQHWCVETYRLATWRAETTDVLTIAEDSTVQYTADILALSPDMLSLRLNLRSEQVELTFEPAQAPFVCPDLPR